jgi:hypothetical protein
MKQNRASQKSAGKILAEGESKALILCVKFAGLIVAILALGGIVSFFLVPDRAKDIWFAISPIISAWVVGLFGYLSGKRARL